VIDRTLIQTETLELLEWQRLCQHLSTFAATKLGAIAAVYLKIPQNQAETLELLDQTKEIYDLEQGLESNWSFEGITDIGEALERAALGGMLSGKELLDLATTLAGMRRMRRVIEAKEELITLKKLISEVRTYPELEQEIHHCIDDRGEVADRASAKLGDIRSNLKNIRDHIYQKLQNIIQRQSGAVQESVITQRGDRFVIPVKAPQKDQIPGIVHDISSTGSTLYIEPHSVVELGNKLRQYRRQEQAEEERILKALTEQIEAVLENLEHLLAVATKLDLATAKARYSLWLEANPPRFIDNNETITLRQLRHPLLVWQEKHEQGTPVIPINVLIDPKIRVVAITGPNTGGKTVTLKTLGLAALMAKVGLFIPAKEPVELPWFKDILADIGDEQSLEQSLSTFSGHIKRISRILTALSQTSEVYLDPPQPPLLRGELDQPPLLRGELDQPSLLSRDQGGISPNLVLLDEVGAGTDPAEGSALAIALLKHLADQVQLTIATTHYGELKALKYQDERFENASVEFDDNSLQPTYRLLWGIPGRSNALIIAKRLGLNPEIIENAQNRVGGYSEEINQTIAGLEKQRREQETKANEARRLLEETERFYRELSEKASNLQEREQNLKLLQEQEVQKAIAEAKEDIAKVIRKLQQGPQLAQNAQKATEKLNEIAENQLPNLATHQRKPSYRPKIGEKVRIPRLGQTAEVLEIGEGDEDITIRFGLMKMTLPLADIESLDGQKVEITPKPKASIPVALPKSLPMVQTSQNTLDIRGQRVNEAEIEIEKAIAKAVASGFGGLWVIHGKGTGKLRQGVHEFLQQHPQVEKFELASQKEGGAGVTIAYLT
jgi:DNA mismatch repair protein MutS2